MGFLDPSLGLSHGLSQAHRGNSRELQESALAQLDAKLRHFFAERHPRQRRVEADDVTLGTVGNPAEDVLARAVGQRGRDERPAGAVTAMSKTRAVAYLRVSTEKQADKGVSLEAQRAKVDAYAQLYELELADVVIDAGVSAKTLDRRCGFSRGRPPGLPDTPEYLRGLKEFAQTVDPGSAQVAAPMGTRASTRAAARQPPSL